MVGDDHTLAVGELIEGPHAERHACELEETAGDQACGGAAPREPGEENRRHERTGRERNEQDRSVQAVREPYRKPQQAARSRDERVTTLACHCTDINQYRIGGM